MDVILIILQRSGLPGMRLVVMDRSNRSGKGTVRDILPWHAYGRRISLAEFGVWPAYRHQPS
jgi:hypothetical protein